MIKYLALVIGAIGMISAQNIYDDTDNVLSKEKNLNDTIGKQWFLGLHGGGYGANKKTAAYYQGRGLYGLLSIDEVLSQQTANGSSFYQELRNVLGYDFTITGYPSNMRYRVGVNFGFFGGVSLNKKAKVFIGLNYADLKLLNFITITENNPSLAPSAREDNNIVIQGKEKRLALNIVFQKDFLLDDHFGFYVDMGAQLNVVAATSNDLYFNDGQVQFNIFTPLNNYNPSRASGFGLGAFGGAGLIVDLDAKWTLQLGGRAYYAQANLFNGAPYALQWEAFGKLFWML